MSAAFGYSSLYHSNFYQYRGMGAYLLLVAYILWASRFHIKDIFSSFHSSNDNKTENSQEPMPYPWAVIGLIFSILATAFMLKIAGAAFWHSVLYVLFYLTTVIVISWIVVTSGLPYLYQAGLPDDYVLSFLSSSRLEPATLTIFTLSRMTRPTLRAAMMPRVMYSLKVSDQVSINPRKLFAVLAGTISIGAIVVSVAHLKLMYTVSANGLKRWGSFSVPQNMGSRLVHLIQYPSGVDFNQLLFMLIGGGFILAMLVLWERFLWWPLHPIGFLTANFWFMWNMWFSIFLGSIVKRIVLKFGGLEVYRKIQPLFFGLIIGDAIMAAVFSVVAWATGTIGYDFLPV